MRSSLRKRLSVMSSKWSHSSLHQHGVQGNLAQNCATWYPGCRSTSGMSVATITEVGEVVDYATRRSSFSWFFKAGALSFDDALVVTMAGTSRANDRAWAIDLPEKHRSHRARIAMLIDPRFDVGSIADFYRISFDLNLTRCACMSPLLAETLAPQLGVYEGWVLRPALSDTMGKPRRADWENSAAIVVRHNCARLIAGRLTPPWGKVREKRLSIVLDSLWYDMWTLCGEEVCRRDPTELLDNIRWLGSSSMLVGGLTKAMAPEEMQIML